MNLLSRATKKKVWGGGGGGGGGMKVSRKSGLTQDKEIPFPSHDQHVTLYSFEQTLENSDNGWCFFCFFLFLVLFFLS